MGKGNYQSLAFQLFSFFPFIWSGYGLENYTFCCEMTGIQALGDTHCLCLLSVRSLFPCIGMFQRYLTISPIISGWLSRIWNST